MAPGNMGLRVVRGRLKTWITAASKARNGNVALIFALSVPVLAICAVGAIQLSVVVSTRVHAQDVADNAALMGAGQLSMTPYRASERAVNWARAELAAQPSPSTFQVTGGTLGRDGVRVSIDSQTPSFFGELFSKGGFRAHAEATAEQLSLSPLCVLAHDSAAGDVSVSSNAQLSGACLLHSNHDVAVALGARLAVARTEAVGQVQGSVNPAGLSGASSIPDPFAHTDLTFPAPCAGSGSTDYYAGTLSPGVFQKDMNIIPGASVTLSPGIYYICGSLTLGKNAMITGDRVLLMFGPNGQFNAGPGSTVSLSGLQSGALAGFVLTTTRVASRDFHLNVDRFSRITGAIYLPAANLVLDGSGQGAQASDWTVIASRGLSVTGSANVVINTNYAGSFTPVPVGVGDHTPRTAPLVH